VLAEKNKLLLDEDAAAGNKPTQHILPVVLHAQCNVIQTSKKCLLIGVKTHTKNFPRISYTSVFSVILATLRIASKMSD
jgi:hypothetical protein